jgi:hypothetical protein
MSYSACPNQWHAQFSHPSSEVVRSILRLNNLLCPKESTLSSVCNACQLAKSRKLPYNNLTNWSPSPLEFVYSDVWDPGPTSVGGYNYYISFIDDFTKFMWIFLMTDRANAQCIFMQF